MLKKTIIFFSGKKWNKKHFYAELEHEVSYRFSPENNG